MAFEIPGFSFSLQANQDMSTEATYLFTPVAAVAATGTGVVGPVACAPVAATGNPIIGILQNNPQLAEAGTIVNTGISKALMGSTCTVGAKLMAVPSGGFIIAQSTYYATAIALDAATAINQYISVLLVNLGKQ